MRKTNRKGFTIVELVIVIAVIAILAAVLIPTFASIVSKANESNLQQSLAIARKNVLAENAADNEFSEADVYYVKKDGANTAYYQWKAADSKFEKVTTTVTPEAGDKFYAKDVATVKTHTGIELAADAAGFTAIADVKDFVVVWDITD